MSAPGLDISSVRRMPDSRDTLLHTAAGSRHLEVLKLIMAYFNNLDILDDNNNTPIFHAVNWAWLAGCKALVRAGATVDQRCLDDAIGARDYCKGERHGSIQESDVCIEYLRCDLKQRS